MTSVTVPRSTQRPRRLRAIVLAIVAAGMAVTAFALLLLSGSPSVPDPGPPDARSVAEARALAESMRDFVVVEATEGKLRFGEGEVGAALASARRVIPGILGRFEIAGDVARMEVSLGGPVLPSGIWLNGALELAASDDGLDVVSARIGRVPVPAAIVLPVARFALDSYLGEGLGSEALDAVSAVEVGSSEMIVSFAFPQGEDTRTFFERLRARLHVMAGGEGAERIHTHLWWLHEAEFDAEDGLVPFLRHAVETARRLSKGDDRSELEAAFFALGLYCGDALLGEAAGVKPNPRYIEGQRLQVHETARPRRSEEAFHDFGGALRDALGRDGPGRRRDQGASGQRDWRKRLQPRRHGGERGRPAVRGGVSRRALVRLARHAGTTCGPRMTSCRPLTGSTAA